MNVDELIERLESLYINKAERAAFDAIIALREQQAEIEMLAHHLELCKQSCGEWADDNERLERLNGGLKNDMKAAGKVIDEQQAEIERLEDGCGHRDEQITTLWGFCNHKDAEIERLRAEIAELNATTWIVRRLEIDED